MKPDPSPKADIDTEVAFWKDEVDTYEKTFDKFLRRGRKIMKKYKDVRSPREDTVTRYNILWANTQTRLPALYARNPKPIVERRYRDKDPVGRVASEILERSIEYTLEHCNDAWQVNRQAVLDYELPGRGMVWIRYVPHFHKQALAKEEAHPEGTIAPELGGSPVAVQTPEIEKGLSPDVEIAAEGVMTTNVQEDESEEETLHYEEAKLDYVYWEDYGHSWARVDDEVRAKWRRTYLDREELTERFGKSKANPEGLTKEEISEIPLDWSPKTLVDTKVSINRKKAIVYEIWDKRKRKVLWLVKNFHKLLDERDDPLGLTTFFPCPRALAANLMTDELTPTPNFVYYQDQANEIDELSTRIASITKCLKVAGVRDTSAEGLDRLLSEGVENQLIPVNGWAALKEKGGLAGTFELLPMKDIAETLGHMREQRKELIEDVYQLTGIADIVRGMSDPNETATAQQIKGQFSMVRLEDSQAEVQRFCRDEIRIIGEIVAGYDIETLKQICGVKLLTAQEKRQIQMELAAQQRMAQMRPPMPPQGPPQASGVPASPSPAGMPPQAPQAAGGMHPGMPSMPQTPMAGQAPVSPEKLKLLELPTWEEIAALLENPVTREFRLDIETDSTIRMDEEAEKKARIELITAVTGYLTQMVEAGMQAPEILPMLGELLMFGLRAFKTARAVEQTFDDMMEALEKQAKQPRPPDPKIVEAQIKAKTEGDIAHLKAGLETQVAQAKEAAEARREQTEQQLESQRDQHKATLDANLESHKAQLQAHTDTVVQDLKNQFEAQRIQWETAAKERIALLEADTKIKVAGMEHEHKERLEGARLEHEGRLKDKELSVEREQKGEDRKHAEKIAKENPKAKAAESKDKHGEKISKAVSELAEHLKRPRKVKRDESGRISEIG